MKALVEIYLPGGPSFPHSNSEELVSINWHVWPFCNYSCTFCFANFAEIKRALSMTDAKRVVALLAQAGVRKLTFAGGEPTLCPWLDVLLAESKRLGMTTMVVTNGTGLTPEFLRRTRGTLDWVALSIDSPDEETERLLGRGRGGHVAQARRLASLLKENGVRVKVNTVVTRANLHDDMHELIRDLAPERWKVFQMLPIAGENDTAVNTLSIDREEFAQYVARHADLSPIAEDNDAMTGSYLMLDPLARFFQNTQGAYATSSSVFEVGVSAAARQAGWDFAKFVDRGGIYAW